MLDTLFHSIIQQTHLIFKAGYLFLVGCRTSVAFLLNSLLSRGGGEKQYKIILLFNTMISFLKLTASLNKILLFRKGSFDGWCPCASKLNSRSKEEVNSVIGESLSPANSGVIDKTPHLAEPQSASP